jgi:hypothetical protein
MEDKIGLNLHCEFVIHIEKRGTTVLEEALSDYTWTTRASDATGALILKTPLNNPLGQYMTILEALTPYTNSIAVFYQGSRILASSNEQSSSYRN